MSEYETTLCWKCSKQYLMREIKCPHCDAGNANFAFAAPAEQRTAAPSGMAMSMETIAGTRADAMAAATLTREQPPALSDAEIDALQSHFVNRNTHLHPVFDQAKRAKALEAEVERLRVKYDSGGLVAMKYLREIERLKSVVAVAEENALQNSKKYLDASNRAESAERRCDAAVAALKLMREEYAKLPHSLGYSFTHLPKIDEAIKECGK